MAKATKPTDAAIQAFKLALCQVIREHGLTLRSYHIEYDEYDSDDGINIVPVSHHSGVIEHDIMLAAFKET